MMMMMNTDHFAGQLRRDWKIAQNYAQQKLPEICATHECNFLVGIIGQWIA